MLVVEDVLFCFDVSKLLCEVFIKQCIIECWYESYEYWLDFKYIRYCFKFMQ